MKTTYIYICVYWFVISFFVKEYVCRLKNIEEDERVNHSKLLESLIKNHDQRIRPNVHGEAVLVKVGLHIRSFDSISEATMDYAITTYFRQYWNDPRLRFNASGFMNMNGDFGQNLWLPDLYFENAKATEMHKTTKDNSFLRIYPNGDVSFSVRLGLILTCNMHLERFPMDQQKCNVEVETYSYTTSAMKLQWFNESPITVDKEVVLPQYRIINVKWVEITRPYSTGNYSHLIGTFYLKRELGFYMLQAYVPSILLVILSWFSLWMEPTAAPARVALGITTVLALVTQSTWMRSQLPKIAYATAIDIWMVTCQVFVFTALLQFAIVYYLSVLHRATTTAAQRRKKSLAVNGTIQQTTNYKELSSPESKRWITRSSSLSNVKNDCEYMEISLRRAGRDRENNDWDNLASTSTNNSGNGKTITRRDYGRMSANFDRYSRVIFPILFLIFNSFYWYKFLINIPEADVSE